MIRAVAAALALAFLLLAPSAAVGALERLDVDSAVAEFDVDLLEAMRDDTVRTVFLRGPVFAFHASNWPPRAVSLQRTLGE